MHRDGQRARSVTQSAGHPVSSRDEECLVGPVAVPPRLVERGLVAVRPGMPLQSLDPFDVVGPGGQDRRVDRHQHGGEQDHRGCDKSPHVKILSSPICSIAPQGNVVELFLHPPSGRVARNERGGLSGVPAVSGNGNRFRPPRALEPDPPGGRVVSTVCSYARQLQIRRGGSVDFRRLATAATKNRTVVSRTMLRA